MAEKDNAGKVGVAVGTTALIASAIALMQKSKVSAAPADAQYVVALDEATQNLLLAIAQAGQKEEEYSQQLVSVVQNLSLAVVPNTETILATRVQVPAVGRTQQLPDIPVPDDMILQLKGWPTNGGLVYVGNSATTAANINQSWPLLANEAIGYRVKNANAIYISGTAAGDWLAITVEQRGRAR
ncbi:MAG: hypothetical protein PHQ43_06425 [Dehalococcoidales bacterium]|nr:hypothetical protein [Dehalococcoidales bacterium]